MVLVFLFIDIWILFYFSFSWICNMQSPDSEATNRKKEKVVLLNWKNGLDIQKSIAVTCKKYPGMRARMRVLDLCVAWQIMPFIQFCHFSSLKYGDFCLNLNHKRFYRSGLFFVLLINKVFKRQNLYWNFYKAVARLF